MSDKEYRDKEKLQKAYEKLGSQQKVADKFGVARTTIQRQMKKNEIEAEKHNPDKVVIECDNCGDKEKRRPSIVEPRDNHFCDTDCHAKWQKENSCGENNNNWKSPASMDCEWCGTHFKFPNKYKEERRFCSLDCSNEWKSANLLGEDHHNWTGGTWQFEYGANWREMREKVIERDSVCRICGHDGSEDRHEVHHVTPLRKFDSPEEANTMSNLILLCCVCHRHVENNMATCPTP